MNTANILTFDMLLPGSRIGQSRVVVDQSLLRLWKQVYQEACDSNTVPLGMASIVLMRAHSTILLHRPPGNIHIGQQFSIHHRIEVDQPLLASISCRDKRVSGSRRIVTFDVEVADEKSGRKLLDGANTMFWAA